MEVLLLALTILAVLHAAYSLFRGERGSDKPGLGLFSFKESQARPPARKGRRDA